jgi:hypothetical protein
VAGNESFSNKVFNFFSKDSSNSKEENSYNNKLFKLNFFNYLVGDSDELTKKTFNYLN